MNVFLKYCSGIKEVCLSTVGSLYCQGVRASMGGARVPEDSEKKAGHSSEA